VWSLVWWSIIKNVQDRWSCLWRTFSVVGLVEYYYFFTPARPAALIMQDVVGLFMYDYIGHPDK